MMGDWVEELCKIFQKEIIVYTNLLAIELKKREAVNKADGRSLQEYNRETYNLMVEASEMERVRMRSIEEVYRKNNLIIEKEAITLTDFLNKIDRDSNFQLKGYATELKTIVHKLKESIVINDKLINTRQELLNKTIEAMKKADAETTYTTSTKTKKTPSKTRALVLNTSA
ncbi:flagellar export chaperone FlgN [Leptospira sp. GIMC2001]|uniref:flagellar export chaperone FlgN n=1 Tax=Leptospira sp. GIMC2001 TaxID=1513297 RepID=UPI00234BC84F|nr:flagellar export chaperone FlgN [Leptospira sp. GIMC2001]WCL50059.1 flagellar export chaperone FlgN [Leptospira sp. GIMC2001]